MMCATALRITPQSCSASATPLHQSATLYRTPTRVRDANMAEELFWSVLHHLTQINPRFGGRTFRGFPRRFKRVINVVDATTIQLVANCMDWASHRRKKAAAKMHLGLNLQSFLPRFAIIDTARQSDSKRARELCADMRGGRNRPFRQSLHRLQASVRTHGRGVCSGLRVRRTTCRSVVANACFANR